MSPARCDNATTERSGGGGFGARRTSTKAADVGGTETTRKPHVSRELGIWRPFNPRREARSNA